MTTLSIVHNIHRNKRKRAARLLDDVEQMLSVQFRNLSQADQERFIADLSTILTNYNSLNNTNRTLLDLIRLLLWKIDFLEERIKGRL